MEQGLRQERVLTPPLCSIFFVVVINVVYTRFKADTGIIDALVHLRKKKEARGGGGEITGEPALATPLWGMRYVDDAGVIF